MHWQREWQALRLALGLLTRLPVSLTTMPDAALRSRSLHYYPLAGLVIGLALWLVEWVLAGADPLLLSTLLVVAWVAITGALHLDGLADCADAWVGGMGDRARTLAILKDPACGPMGVTAVVLALLLKVAALSVLLRADVAGWWWAPVWARAVLPLAFLALPYVRAGGMGEGLGRGVSPLALAVGIGLTLLLSAATVPGAPWVLWLVGTLSVFGAWVVAMRQRLGGFTGDGAGALVELLEVLLLVLAALWAGGAP